MNYATQVGKPTAHITNKKSRLKVYNGHLVFLNDKDNFEFELHNPKQKSVLVKIKLNGEYISTGGIVLRPGQRVFLDRFLDSNNKFEFSTYEVDDTSENRSAIDLNGDVRIEFYDNQLHQNGYGTYNLTYGTTTTINSGTPYYGGISCTNFDGIYNLNASYTNTSLTSSIETGRIKEGEKSKQKFENSYEEFNYNSSHEISLKILPLGTKNKTTEEIRQHCTECGVKVKKNFKFCPSCGNKI